MEFYVNAFTLIIAALYLLWLIPPKGGGNLKPNMRSIAVPRAGVAYTGLVYIKLRMAYTAVLL